MERSPFVTGCNVIRLYYENAEANIMNDLFFETADDGSDSSFGDKMAELGKKVCAKIDEIIENIKKFFEDLRRKHESAKIKLMLRGECARSMIAIKVTVNDKEIMNAVSQIYKIEQKAFAEIRKVYDQFMGHKIDYDTYCRRTDKISGDAFDAFEKVGRNMADTKIINPNSAKGAYKLSELTKRVNRVDDVYNKVLDKMRDEVIREEEKIKAAAPKVVTDNTSSTATAKTSSTLSRINKKAVAVIISIVGIAGAAAFCHKHGKNASRDPIIKESAGDDYFSDILGNSDSYMENGEEGNMFDDILNM